MRPAHAEKLRAKRLLRELAKSAPWARLAMDPGDECLAFLPDGSLALMHLENENTFRVRELEDEDAAVDVGMRWAREDRAAESIQ
jgi:hypothetical protein